jgi:hypothetical protein
LTANLPESAATMAVVVGDEDADVVDDGGAGVVAAAAEPLLVADVTAAFTSSELELPTAITNEHRKRQHFSRQQTAKSMPHVCILRT